jgi:hypothetical protein
MEKRRDRQNPFEASSSRSFMDRGRKTGGKSSDTSLPERKTGMSSRYFKERK